MSQPDILEPRSLAEAVAALSRPGSLALAGATDIIPALRRGELAPRMLVNLKCLPGLSGVRRSRAALRIGALTPVAELLESALVRGAAPVLVEAAAGFGSPQIRNQATVGGNLCTAAPSADLAPPLLALEARAEIRGPEGRRTVALCEFFRGARSRAPRAGAGSPARARGAGRTVLRRGEVLTALLVPLAPVGAAYVKLTARQAMDLALVSVAAALRLGTDGATCLHACLALGSVAPIPMRAPRAEAELAGQPLTSERIAAAAAVAAGEARPITDLRASAEYRRDMVAVLVRRALEEALHRAPVG